MQDVMWVCAIFYIFVILVPPATLESANEGDALILEHDVGVGTYSLRAKILLPNARRKEAEILSQVELEDADIGILGEESNNNRGMYKLRAKGQGGNATMATGYACGKRLRKAGLRDVVTVFSDEFGNVVSVSIRPQSDIGGRDLTEFSTVLLSQTPSQGPIPDTSGYLNKLREEKIRKEKADKEPKSFFTKYWMYILPVVFLFMMSNANQQQQQ